MEKGYAPIDMKIEWEKVDTKSDLFDSVKDLCLRHNDICANIQRIDGDIKFWVEVK